MKNGATEKNNIEVYAFKMFWIRLANVKYSLDNFDEYQKHFTVCLVLFRAILLILTYYYEGYELYWVCSYSTPLHRVH